MRFARQEYWSGLPCTLQQDLPNLGIEPRSFTLQVDSLPSESPGKPTNTGVGSLSLLLGIFLTQESNWGLLHCRRILYQLSYQGSTCYLTLACGIPVSQPGMEPTSPALQSGCLTTGPPRFTCLYTACLSCLPTLPSRLLPSPTLPFASLFTRVF